MMSTPLTRGFTCCLLMRSALTNLESGLTFSLFPPRRLSALITSCPDSMSLSTNHEPMNPAPPVTNTFLDSNYDSTFHYCLGSHPELTLGLKCSMNNELLQRN